jgi:RNA polymerase sigma factor (sigma-70 family)
MLWLRQPVTTDAKMRLFDKSSWDPTQTSLSAPTGCPTKPNLPGSTEHKPRNDPSAAAALPSPRALLTADQERVMIEHLPLVRIIAWRIHDRLPQQVPIEDLYSAGVLGLLNAFGRFNPSKQVLFRTYVQFRIRGAILDSLRTLDWSPRELRRKGRAVEQAIQLLTAQFHRCPDRPGDRSKVEHPARLLSAVAGGAAWATNRSSRFIALYGCRRRRADLLDGSTRRRPSVPLSGWGDAGPTCHSDQLPA